MRDEFQQIGLRDHRDRTAVVDRASGTAVYGAGGGITWGSDPAREWAELLAKAAVLAHDVADHHLVETLAYVPAPGLRNGKRHLARLADSAGYSPSISAPLASTSRRSASSASSASSQAA